MKKEGPPRPLPDVVGIFLDLIILQRNMPMIASSRIAPTMEADKISTKSSSASVEANEGGPAVVFLSIS